MNTKTAIAAIALLLPSVAIAEPTPHEFCTEIAGLAEVIMEGRQNGTPMPAMMDVAAQGNDTEMNKITEALIIDAFGHPRYSTERLKQITIGDFSDSAYLSCITAIR